MRKLDFVFLRGDVPLRQVVDTVQTALGGDEEWYRYNLLVLIDGAYACIRLTQLSAEVDSSDWSLGSALSGFPLSPCAVLPAGELRQDTLARVRQPFAVVEKDQHPVALYQGRSLRGGPRTNYAGWWRLVGKRMAELGYVPRWPDPLPATVQADDVLLAYPHTTLAELASEIADRTEGRRATVAQEPGEGPSSTEEAVQADAARVTAASDGMMLVTPGEGGRWTVFPASHLLEQIEEHYPDAGPGSQVGAFVELGLVKVISLERSETPWQLIEAFLLPSSSIHLLIAEYGRPVKVLSWRATRRQEVIPMAPAEGGPPGWARFVAQAGQMRRGAQDQARMVNAWFANEHGEYVPHQYALAANRLYQFGVNIGARAQESHSIGAQPALDVRLVNYVIGQGKPIVLRLDSDDFIVLDSEREVSLPAAGTSQDRFFPVVTPVRTGDLRLYLRVYFENNLVQSYRVTARVAPREGRMPDGAGDGWWSECEYTLSYDFTDLENLSPRRVCVWIGDSRGETQRAGIREASGMDMGPALSINTRLIEESLKRYRELLMLSCVRETATGSEYLYESDHTPRDPATFERSVKALAELGQMLYERVLGVENGRRVAQRLREVERAEGRTLVVQIARLDLDLNFPWAVLYDRPLHFHPGRNVVCEGFLDDDACADGCPYTGDSNVICPYGFWGYRYLIEQPLCSPSSHASVATRLRVTGRPRIALVYGAGLEFADYHQQRVESLLGTRAECAVHTETAGLLDEMAAGPSVVYFYCHGGHTSYRQWLVVGDDDPLMPVHLGDSLRAAWTERARLGGSAPLIVLNGCHTGKYDPSTLLSFVHRFGELGAAGVIGTEIPVHEYVGSAFGEFMFSRLMKGQLVGTVVYDFRQELLRRRNVLGLAYVPYCYADLRLEKQS